MENQEYVKGLVGAMQIQSLSVVVPNKKCINDCPFCISKMLNNSSEYPNLMDINHPHYDINVREYLKRLKFVADNGCQTLILTGTSEPQQNKQFLARFALLHQQMGSPFTNIEMQTTGMLLEDNDNYLRFLRNFVGVNTMAISVNAERIDWNYTLLGHVEADEPKILLLHRLCGALKNYDFNIRICINLNSSFNGYSASDICSWASKDLRADQITFRRLYLDTAVKDTPQAKWIADHQPNAALLTDLDNYLAHQSVIGKTPYGSLIYKGGNCAIVYDRDCMGKNPESDVKKYLILRPNCKLYSQWDSSTSLVF